MNIFIIPSWYPSQGNPIAGIFFKEQASYIAELNANLNVGISLWGQSDPALMLNKNLTASLKNFATAIVEKRTTEINSLSNNLHEIKSPTLNWTHKILAGNISKVVEANLHNFTKFEQRFGKVDILHAHVSYPAGYVAMVLAEKFNIPYIITEHMGPFPFKAFITGKGKIYPKLAEPLRKANAVIAVSPTLAEDMAKSGFRRPSFIPNVINEDLFSIKTAAPPSPFIYFTLATVSQEKGFDDLLDAIAIVSGKRSDVVFEIGGGGSAAALYKRKAAALGIEKFIQWLGPLSREEASKRYQKCHAFVLPSHGETFGVVYAEALASGKPVIATRCGGPECIVDDSNGLFAEVKNSTDLAAQIIYMVDNYARYDAAKIRQGFEGKFSKKVVIPQIVGLYKSLVRKPKK